MQDVWKELEARLLTCRRCPRLVAWREKVAQTKRRAYRHETYWGRPVPGFGDRKARILIVGLAPGAHGANRTGRMFTGDASGAFLFAALHRAGFANQPLSLHRDDGLRLQHVYISAVVRCVPPQNRPTAAEIHSCLPFLREEVQLLSPYLQVIVALGRIAFSSVLRTYQTLIQEHLPRWKFAHGSVYTLPPLSQKPVCLIASYHPSRQNTQTGRLTQAMFDRIWSMARSCLATEPDAKPNR